MSLESELKFSIGAALPISDFVRANVEQRGLHLIALGVELDTFVALALSCGWPLVKDLDDSSSGCPTLIAGPLVKKSLAIVPLYRLPTLKIKPLGYCEFSFEHDNGYGFDRILSSTENSWALQSEFAEIVGSKNGYRVRIKKKKDGKGPPGFLHLYQKAKGMNALRLYTAMTLEMFHLACALPKDENECWNAESKCKWRRRRPPGTEIGDPHCVTFDGLTFECNFLGESTYAKCEDLKVHVFAEQILCLALSLFSHVQMY